MSGIPAAIAIGAVLLVGTGLLEAWGYLQAAVLDNLAPNAFYALGALAFVAAVLAYGWEQGAEESRSVYRRGGRGGFRASDFRR